MIFIPIGFIAFHNQGIYTLYEGVCTIFDNFNRLEFVSNFVGLSNTYNYEWWFFRPYIVAILLETLLNTYLKNGYSFITDSFMIILIYILTVYLFPELCYKLSNIMIDDLSYSNFFMLKPCVILFLEGMIFAKHDRISKIVSYFDSYTLLFRLFIVSLSFIIMIFIRELIHPLSSDIDLLIVPSEIVCMLMILNTVKFPGKFLTYIGKHSTNIWLSHSFFYYYFGFFAKIVFFSQNVLLSLLTLLLLSLLSDYVVEFIWTNIKKDCLKLGILHV